MSLPAIAASSTLAAAHGERAQSTARPSAPAAPPPAAEAADGEGERQQVEAATRELKQKLEEKGVELTIEFDDEVDRSIVKLVDSRTGELLRQIPSEEMLVLARALARSDSVGALVQTRA